MQTKSKEKASQTNKSRRQIKETWEEKQHWRYMYTSYCPDLETTPSLCYKAYDKKFNKLSIRFKQFITRSNLMLWKV